MSVLQSLRIKNVRLRTKIIILLSIPTLALIFTAFLTVSNMNTLTANKSEIYSSSSLTLNADRDMYQAYVAVQDLLIFDKQSKEYKDSMDSFKENVEQVNERITKVTEFVTTIEELKHYQHRESNKKIEEPIEQFQKQLKSWTDLSSSIIQSTETQSNEQSLQSIALSIKKIDVAYNAARDELNLVGEIIDEFSDNRIQEDNKLKESTRMTIFLAVSSALIIVTIVGLIFIRALTSPIYKVVEHMNQLAQGDFTVKNNVYNGTDEIGQLIHAVNNMISNLRDLFLKASETSKQVAASSEELTASAEQTAHASNQITTAIQEVASGAETQGQAAEESANAMKELAIGIQRVAETSSSVSEAAMETQKEAVQGNESIRKVIAQMSTINQSSEQTASLIKQLGERSIEIGKIVDVITGIATQTNLLALNAAIEAARAGEHGKGFAVVANEVKKLAEQSRASSSQIAELIGHIQRDTTLAVEAMAYGTKEVEAGMDVVQSTGDGFQYILRSIEQVAADIQEVSAVAEQMSASVEQVHASAQGMAHSAKHSASNTQNVAAASEEQMASIEEITASASSMSQTAEELRTIVARFKI
ncbi:methyl-accepting chemotaxis protein [Paenibacillus sp. GSMTC-2017]|uniref:methyl-accepting chemotaxis protein n=1 Tax=Paenibacillus sp. GSMTC-2017 TaxID=2794350 RepID=UPI0018D8C94F|nr:HAMP domain-containing methyl-accepting chemotaxis protein [Paenibacillus sp. GSMTC-2017]MBH5320359.1 methyl-accepting chemotaxis protein [Paenibacillus sp. GSMTC-2017]